MSLELDAGELVDGAFTRQQSRFREQIDIEGLRSGRYHLYISLACPWSHRAAILRELTGLADALPISYLAPYRDRRGWAFTGERFEDGPGGEYVDRANGWEFLSSAYEATEPGYDRRVTVPVLWDTAGGDRAGGRIANNESADMVRVLASAQLPGALARHGIGTAVDGDFDLYPSELREQIDAVNERVYRTINNGVYRAGFAHSQRAYDAAVAELFESLQWLEDLLARQRYLVGGRITEAEWRLFPTLVRFDEVYHTHFRCNYRRIVEYPNLWAYTRELYQLPGIAATVAMEQIKRHYYTTHDELNPKRIIPIGPGPDFLAPHGRG